MDREIIQTSDGSHTMAIPKWNVTYHSRHGAIQESLHVFIEAGFHFAISQSINQSISIFEMGFGTGLNAFLTGIEAINKKIKVYYAAVEQYPLTIDEIRPLNYTERLLHDDLFQRLHSSAWNEDIMIDEFFYLRKEKVDLVSYSPSQLFDIIYYDAFAPAAQPHLWTLEIFKKLHSMLAPGGILVTYCSKGEVRRAMQSTGFIVEKIPGPPGKREMVRAGKSSKISQTLEKQLADKNR